MLAHLKIWGQLQRPRGDMLRWYQARVKQQQQQTKALSLHGFLHFEKIHCRCNHFCKLPMPIDCNQCSPSMTGPTPHPFHSPAAPRDNEEWKMCPNHLSLSMIAISETCFMYVECYQKLWDMTRKYLTLFWAVRDEGVHCASVSPERPPRHHLSALQPILSPIPLAKALLIKSSCKSGIVSEIWY